MASRKPVLLIVIALSVYRRELTRREATVTGRLSVAAEPGE
jgi:hypothetical protein